MCGGIYDYCAIVHEENFMDTNDHNIHTKNVENMLRAKKNFVGNLVLRKDCFIPIYMVLCREISTRKSKSQVFSEFIITVAAEYPVS